MEYLILLLRWLHIIPAVVMVGGLVYMRCVLPKPLVDGSDPQFADLRQRWARVVMISSGLLLLTGIANMGINGANFDYGEELPGKLYNMLAGIKFLAALPVFFFAARLSGKSESAAKMRQNSDLWLNVTLAIAIAVIMLGGFLRTLPREPKASDEASASVAPLNVHWLNDAVPMQADGFHGLT